jgi:uncharacterized iron-regulated membrane protein
MANNLTNTAENLILDHFLGVAAYTFDSTVFAGLYTVAPTDSTAGTEVTGGSYVRQAITFSAASGGATSNTTDVDFTGMPAATTVAVAIHTASTGGTMLMYGTLTTNKTTDAGDTLRIATGDLDISID